MVFGVTPETRGDRCRAVGEYATGPDMSSRQRWPELPTLKGTAIPATLLTPGCNGKITLVTGPMTTHVGHPEIVNYLNSHPTLGHMLPLTDTRPAIGESGMPFRRPYMVVGIVADLVQLILELRAQSTGVHQTPAETVIMTNGAKVFGACLQLRIDLGRTFGTPG